MKPRDVVPRSPCPICGTVTQSMIQGNRRSFSGKYVVYRGAPHLFVEVPATGRKRATSEDRVRLLPAGTIDIAGVLQKKAIKRGDYLRVTGLSATVGKESIVLFETLRRGRAASSPAKVQAARPLGKLAAVRLRGLK